MGQFNEQVNPAVFTEFQAFKCEDCFLALVEPVERDEDEPSEDVVSVDDAGRVVFAD